MSDQIEIPDAFGGVPRMRFWGDRKPPKNRADMWSTTVHNAADAAPTQGGDTGTATVGKVATLRIYGPIDSWGGWWGVSAADVSGALDTLPDDVDEIRVRINSPGGEVWEGMAILNMLRARNARTVAVVDGLAASAASVIACGLDETVMSPGTQLMIHDASGFAFGPEATMVKAGSWLGSISNSIAEVYAESGGGTREAWRALMVEETWYTATEAVDSGLADRVGVVKDAPGQAATAGEDDPEPATPGEVVPVDDATVEDRFDLSIYMHAGRSHAPAPKPPSASASGYRTTTQEGSPVVSFTDDQLTTMRQALGVAKDADEATIVAALGEALEERAEPTSMPAPVAVPEGHVVVPEARLRDLEANASAGAQAADRLRIQEREAFLDANRTKYAPANRQAWSKEYDRDPEGTRAHFKDATDIISLAPVGRDDDPVKTEADALYEALYTTQEA